MHRRSILTILLTLTTLLLLTSNAADAHMIGGSGFSSGATHPLLGIDHLLAMIAVGIISTRIGGKALWAIPATFVSVMVLGGTFGILGITLPFVEAGIALSLLFFGLAIAFNNKLSIVPAIVSVALFALFHGHAHGNEMSLVANPVLYTTGFVLSTAGLHALGVTLGYYARKTNLSLNALRLSGILMTLTGVAFLIGL